MNTQKTVEKISHFWGTLFSVCPWDWQKNSSQAQTDQEILAASQHWLV